MSPADSILAIGNQTLKVSLGANRGRVIFDIRYQYLHAESGTLRPMQRGVTIPAHHLPEVMAALEALRNEMLHDGFMEDCSESPPKFHPQVYPSDF